jgi:two-component system cell cycle sensor histidine kinase/response regulator CckA
MPQDLLDVSKWKQDKEPVYPPTALTKVPANAIIGTDRNLNITVWNKAAESMFGWQADEALKKPTVPDLRNSVMNFLTRDEIMKCLVDNGSWSGELASHRKDGSGLYTLVSIELLWDSF